MTKRILKYPLADQRTSLPMGPVQLVAQQDGSSLPLLWIEVDVYFETTDYLVFGTGHEIPRGLVHVGSCICGEFVWHVYRDEERFR